MMNDKNVISLAYSSSPESFSANGHNSQRESSSKYGNGDGGGDDMLERVKKLENDVQSMKTDIAVMKSNYATKADVSDAKNSIILWVVGAIILTQVVPAIPKIIEAFSK
ncbi:hypothetical protein ABRQ00_22610 [Pectobacterium aroidearum]|uniref:hypothetical protein n=1 Tax=Pectobacterium aroidearum TaxID=1201031 RepID=UPI002FC936F4